MFDLDETRRAWLTMAGGALWSVALALDDIAPALAGLAVVAPVLLGFGVLELSRRYRGRYGSVGRAGVALTGLGLGLLLVAVLLYAVGPPGLIAAVLVGVPGAAGAATLALGSALLAPTLYRLGLVGAPTALLLGAGIPLTPVGGALLAAIVGPGTPLTPVAPGGIVTGLGGAPYGLAWVVVGYRLWTTAGEDRGPTRTVQPATVGVSPQAVAAGVAGGGLVVLSAGRFLPLGPLSATPWVNESLALDVGHLLCGAAGVGAAASRRARVARAYNRVVGALALALVALTLLGTFLEVAGLAPLTRALDLNVPDVVLHLPAGLVLAVVGYGIETD